MRKNLNRYYQAWELRQQGKKLKEIAQIMGFKSDDWARVMINYFDFRLNSKFRPLSKELNKLVSNDSKPNDIKKAKVSLDKMRGK